MSAPAQSQTPAPPLQVSISDYVGVTIFLILYSIGLGVLATGLPQEYPSPELLIQPMVALVGLTTVVWLLMVIIRNGTILWGITKPDYYRDYQSEQPREWVERPARAFNNLFQVPVLFYVICLLMMITGELDEAQLTLAWVYVGTRAVHAIIYIAWNYVPYRFAAWAASCVTLGVMWWRFAF